MSGGNSARNFPPLAEVTQPTVGTTAAAYYLNRQPQTLREWACFDKGPVRHMSVNGRLAWSVADIRLVLGVTSGDAMGAASKAKKVKNYRVAPATPKRTEAHSLMSAARLGRASFDGQCHELGIVLDDREFEIFYSMAVIASSIGACHAGS